MNSGYSTRRSVVVLVSIKYPIADNITSTFLNSFNLTVTVSLPQGVF